LNGLLEELQARLKAVINKDQPRLTTGVRTYKRLFSLLLSSLFFFFLNGDSPEKGEFSDFIGAQGSVAAVVRAAK
jgi:hypothetical protein